MNLRGNKKKKEEVKKTYAQRVKERMGEHYEEKTFKIHTHTHTQKDKSGEISNVIEENNKNVKRKNSKKAQTMTAESSKAKTTIIYLRQRKNLRKQKMMENNLKLLLSRKFDFDPEEILDKNLLFNLKKNKQR